MLQDVLKGGGGQGVRVDGQVTSPRPNPGYPEPEPGSSDEP